MSASNFASAAARGLSCFALAASLASLLLFASPGAQAQSQSESSDFSWEFLPDDTLDKGFYQSYLYGVPDNPSEDWVLAYGGRLYDLWWVVLLVDPPAGRHPSYPKAGVAADLETWRCVSCHGWDYRGRDGAFASGPNYTGIKGINGKVGADPKEIERILRAPAHGYTEEMIPDNALSALALFVSKGQDDPTAQIDTTTRRVSGRPDEGRRLFQTICAICHDFDGRAYITGEGDGLNTLGAIANSDPWRALHKLSNGQTYADMPALRALGRQSLMDLMAYLQTLPEEPLEP